MDSVITQVIAWPALLVSLLVFGFAPGAALRMIVLAFKRDDPRRKELLAELPHVPRIERPFWVCEQLEVALFEGVFGRLRALAQVLNQQAPMAMSSPRGHIPVTAGGEMLHLRLRDYVHAEDDPGRENNGRLPGWGYFPGMADDEVVALNRWDWILGRERAPRFALFSSEGIFRAAAEITSIEEIPGSRRREIRGRVLDPSHPVYIRYVNKPVPERAKTGRNSVRYFPDLPEGA